ncbi:MAG: Asp-tRNA(Asn)/Glu-tRNA(Gln) amidotransferase GatCAB subunit A [Ignavibacteriales bacterium CG_4_9_14_3_um_filter_34_10]|nr:MAG: Asp-tRNA(Asn)/Glu-tRNA(Gln) amidotransferase GatCAB subunit A [Ignavibacteriales bacterium CG_4_9_14_3_um_filter_34_10]
MIYKNHKQKIELIKSGKISLKQNVADFLLNIKKNEHLNAFNFVFEDSASEVDLIERKIKTGKHGKLAGMVIAVKDVISIKSKPLTCSSNILIGFEAVYNATVVEKLLQENAILIGKTNCDEFAMGSSNENSAFGKVLNPVNNDYVPGGSSGGSAAAVAANLCDAALGTDTGGSIRQPAAFCGVYGLKPTYGRVSRYGLTAFASSFDTIGPFAKNIDDIALILETISGNDNFDSTFVNSEIHSFSEKISSERKFKIGLPKEYFSDGLDDEIRKIIFEHVEILKNAGNEVTEISLPHTEFAIATYYILTTAEASANLSRFDGAHYGLRSKNASNIDEMYKFSRTEGFGEEVKRRIMLGTYVLSSGYYDAYYKKAQKVRSLIKSDFDNAFKEVDIILTPTTPTAAFKIGEKSENPLEMYLSDIYTTSANLAGIPAINVPIGFNKIGLPIGMQLLSKQFDELSLLQLANILSTN